MASAPGASLQGSGGEAPQWGPGAKPLIRGLCPLKLTTFSHLKDTLKKINCTIFSIIYTINNVTIGVGTLLIYKLVNRLADIRGVQHRYCRFFKPFIQFL